MSVHTYTATHIATLEGISPEVPHCQPCDSHLCLFEHSTLSSTNIPPDNPGIFSLRTLPAHILSKSSPPSLASLPTVVLSRFCLLSRHHVMGRCAKLPKSLISTYVRLSADMQSVNLRVQEECQPCYHPSHDEDGYVHYYIAPRLETTK